jgi:hypothetical protein
LATDQNDFRAGMPVLKADDELSGERYISYQFFILDHGITLVKGTIPGPKIPPDRFFHHDPLCIPDVIPGSIQDSDDVRHTENEPNLRPNFLSPQIWLILPNGRFYRAPKGALNLDDPEGLGILGNAGFMFCCTTFNGVFPIY